MIRSSHPQRDESASPCLFILPSIPVSSKTHIFQPGVRASALSASTNAASEGEQEALKSRVQRRMRELAVHYERTRVEIETAILMEVGSEPVALAKIAAEALVQCRDGRLPKAGRHDSEMQIAQRRLRRL